MFIQSAPPGEPHRAIAMRDHAALSGQFARAFGNAAFAAPTPFELVAYIITHHDAGWAAFDRDPATDPQTGLPYTVFDTPAQHIIPTSKGSPDFNQRQHPFCGLLSSMHTWGIYNGRYGFSSAGRLNRLAPDDQAAVEAMLSAELERQQRHKAELAQSPKTAAWIGEDWLFQNYKLLQFCDLLAIYFNRSCREHRTEQAFTHVPIDRDRDVTITIRARAPGVYSLAPFPFAAEGAQFAFPSRAISPGQHERAGGWAQVLATTRTEWETVQVVAD